MLISMLKVQKPAILVQVSHLVGYHRLIFPPGCVLRRLAIFRFHWFCPLASSLTFPSVLPLLIVTTTNSLPDALRGFCLCDMSTPASQLSRDLPRICVPLMTLLFMFLLCCIPGLHYMIFHQFFLFYLVSFLVVNQQFEPYLTMGFLFQQPRGSHDVGL